MRIAPTWADHDLDGVKFDRNAIELPRYASIERNFSRAAQDLISGYMGGELTRRDTARLFKEQLEQHETEAFVAGRRARGIAIPEITNAEAGMLAARHERNMGYFRGFLDDIDAGKYESGRNGPMTPAKRADLYARSLWSLYTRGETQDWAEPENINARYHWIMDPDAEHCKDCLERAGRSRDSDGFTWEELVAIGFPGENTVCRVHCRCHIQTIAKRSLQPARYEKATPASDPQDGLENFIAMLGGPKLPIRIPAAGVPSVSVKPSVLEASIVGAGKEGFHLARYLPIVPKILTKPEAVIEQGGIRAYTGEGLTVYTALDELGRWTVLSFAWGLPSLEEISKS